METPQPFHRTDALRHASHTCCHRSCSMLSVSFWAIRLACAKDRNGSFTTGRTPEGADRFVAGSGQPGPGDPLQGPHPTIESARRQALAGQEQAFDATTSQPTSPLDSAGG
jgi:hypothetical protein